MKFENTETWGFEHAIRGMRNSHESWDKSDSGYYGYCPEDHKWVKEPCSYDACLGACVKNKEFKLGENDLKLAQTLIKAGSEHRKFMRQIFVSVDITAPLYWWKEFDTYKVGTVANSTSTMHKLASTPITRECFEMDDFENVQTGVQSFVVGEYWVDLIECLESLRQLHNKNIELSKAPNITDQERKRLIIIAKKYWKELIRLLPESWLQKRTVTMSYENILKMVRERINHKLSEWSKSFIDWAKSLPYAKELLFI